MPAKAEHPINGNSSYLSWTNDGIVGGAGYEGSDKRNVDANESGPFKDIFIDGEGVPRPEL